MAKDCPIQGTQGRGVGRVYIMDAKKAKGNSGLISGTCYVNNQPLFVIFDCGASHSFILTKCA